MNFQGCSGDMKAKAEQYLKANYLADWSPPVVPPVSVPIALAARPKAATSGLVAMMNLVNCQMGQLDNHDSEHDDEPLQPVQLQTEVDKYLALPQLPYDRNGKDTNPLDWWKLHAPQLPNLAMMARQFLAMPASSAGPERAFSAAGRMHDGLKKNQKESTIGHMLEVKVNIQV
jgi:hypothetical protein